MAASNEENFKPRYTVASLTAEIRSLLEPQYRRIFVDGEISNWRVSSPGHAYFVLKDAEAQISVTMFANCLMRCKARERLRDGAKVLVCGKVSVYGPHGNYQLVAIDARIEGEGDLMQRFLELKAKLSAEGLFEASRKRPLPFLPRRIGVVTSETGAVIHDMCTVLTRRFPNVEIRLFPCLVQGEGAAETIAAGIRYFNSLTGAWQPDLLIVARGGGSFEDLFCFNDETLVRTLAASRIPTISAVGHETDFTLCDFAADKRAGTPSIAAEIAVPRLTDLTARLSDLSARLAQSLPRLADLSARLSDLSTRLAQSLQGKGEFYSQRVDQLTDALANVLRLALTRVERRLEVAQPRFTTALRMRHQQLVARLEKAEARLTAYSPYGVLERGYSLTTTANGAVVRDATQLAGGEVIYTRFAKGTAKSVVSNASGVQEEKEQ